MKTITYLGSALIVIVSVYFLHQSYVAQKCATLSETIMQINSELDMIWNTGTANPDYSVFVSDFNNQRYPAWRNIYTVCVDDGGSLRTPISFGA